MILIMSQLLTAISRLPAKDLRLSAGQTLFCQGDRIRSLYLIETGLVHLIRHQADGSATVMQRARHGTILAEASLFSERYHCDAIVIAPTSARIFEAALMRREMAADPSLAQAWAAHLAREVQRTRIRAEILAMKTVRERLDAWIAICNEPLPQKGERRSLADELGITPEALYREIARRRDVSGE